MSVYMRGKKWYCNFSARQADGTLKRTRLVLEAVTRADAKREELSLRAIAGRTSGRRSRRVYTVRDGFNDTWEAKWAFKKAQKSTRLHIEEICALLGNDFPVSLITRETIANLKRLWLERGNSPATVNRKLSPLSVMLRWCARN